MLEKAIEREQPVLPVAAGAPTGRFARDPAEYATGRTTQLTLIPGGANAARTQNWRPPHDHHSNERHEHSHCDQPDRSTRSAPT